MQHYVFGPVPSRRLGRSLGVDLVPFKTCTYDCIYCQLGRTTCKSVERKPWVPLETVLDQLQQRLSSQPDYITLSGSGEPTLHAQAGQLIRRIKALTRTPVAVLTNGGLLWSKQVRRQLLPADLVIPSLDAGNPAMFQAVNRPHAEITFERMLDGLVAFRREFAGDYWLEVMLVGGYTATPAEVRDLAACVDKIRPDRVQLNTVTRPPAEPRAKPVSAEEMAEYCGYFSVPAEVIADFRQVHGQAEFAAGQQEVLALLQRRPCSLEDIACGLGMHQNEVLKYVEQGIGQGKLQVASRSGKRYFQARQRAKILSGQKIGFLGKGGAGKTTAVILFARALARAGYSVCIFDADSTNVGLHQALGIRQPPRPLIDYFGGMVFSGGSVTCPVDDPTPLPGAEVCLDTLPEQYYAEGLPHVFLLCGGKLGGQGAGAGCDGPISKIARDIRLQVGSEPPVTLVDFKAGFEDTARGVVTGMDGAVVIVDPTQASLALARHMKEMLEGLRRGHLPATRHLASAELVSMANRTFQQARLKRVVFVLNRVADQATETFLRRQLAEQGIEPIGVIHNDPEIAKTCLAGSPLDDTRLLPDVEPLVAEIEQDLREQAVRKIGGAT